ncbi:MAG: hypothetical protein WDA06_00165 [Phenylobacterium sp.]
MSEDENIVGQDLNSEPEIEVADDVSTIPKNKHNKNVYNYNSGKLVVKCIINGNCPVLKQPLVDNAIIFNSSTARFFSENDISNLSFVKDQEGIFLQEKYNYRSNFLVIEDEKLEGEIEGLANAEYREDQTWNVVKSVFDSASESLLRSSEYILKDCNITKTCPRWQYFRHNKPVDSEIRDNFKKRNKNEAKDSAILVPTQMAADANKNIGKGIHWRVEKKTKLFKGEDFFVEFIRTAITTDFKNIDSVPFENEDYIFLDAIASPAGDDENPPANYGVVEYEIGRDNNGVPNAEYKKNEDSIKFFDLNKQAYYIIEIGTSDRDAARYFIIITQKSYPRFVKVVNGISFGISSYKVSGDSLIQQHSLRVTVRNHLGGIFITFSGHEDNPWIVRNNSILETEDPILRIPKVKMAIWGGNIAAGFIFGPLQYADSYVLEMPPLEKNISSDKTIDFVTKKVPYELPIFGVDKNAILLSVTDEGLDATSKPGSTEEDSISSNSENTTTDELGGEQSESFIEDRKPIFSSDFQLIKETQIKISDGEPGNPQQFTPDEPTYFLTTEDYIKAYSGENNASSVEVEVIIKDDDGKTGIYAATNDAILSHNQAIVDNSLGRISDEQLANAANNEAIARDKQEKALAEDALDIKRHMKFFVKLTISSGHHEFDGWTLYNCKTPVITNMRLVSVPDYTDGGWETEPVDVSSHVLNFSESWAAQDFHSMQHSGSISFLLNKGMNFPNDQTDYLMDIRSKAFYIEIWAGYDGCNYSQMNGLFKLFTGLCLGGNISESAGKRILECQLFDYVKICQESYMFNSPFFDGVRDINAADIIANMIGFKCKESPEPGYLLKAISKNKGNDNITSQTLDGRGYSARPYVFPSSYARLLQPFMKFDEGKPFWEILNDFAQKAGKVVFFDAYGMLHYENLPVSDILFKNQDPNAIEPLWNFTRFPWGEGQQVFNVITRERAAYDVFNNLHVVTTTPNYELLHGDNVNWESIHDPSSPGFLGYRKLFFQQDGIFGSEKALNELINHYKLFYRAPVIYKFETFGQPLRCFDIVDLDDQKLIIINISSELSPSENKWWQTIEGEWYHGETGKDEVEYVPDEESGDETEE